MTDAQRQAIQREDTVDPVAAALGTVGEAMTKKVVFVRSDLPLTGVAEILNERRLSGAPVVDQGRLVGIVTLQDSILRIALPTYQVEKVVSMHGWEYLLAELSRRRFSVRDVMTPQVATVRESVALVIRAARAIKRLPVVDDEGRLCRILSRAGLDRDEVPQGGVATGVGHWLGSSSSALAKTSWARAAAVTAAMRARGRREGSSDSLMSRTG